MTPAFIISVDIFCMVSWISETFMSLFIEAMISVLFFI